MGHLILFMGLPSGLSNKGGGGMSSVVYPEFAIEGAQLDATPPPEG